MTLRDEEEKQGVVLLCTRANGHPREGDWHVPRKVYGKEESA